MEFKTKEFVFLAGLGILVASLGLFSFVRGLQAPALIIPGEQAVTVHVAGCVNRPGVYELPAESRIIDAILAAGGETPDADSNRLNLADFLRDGQKVNVPALVESGGEEEGLVNINTADLRTLETLPNIGPTKALKIIQYRERHGYFSSKEEVTNVSTIGPATFEAIKDLITY